eukprot:2740793-Rhodomonas_salina.1
MGNALQDSYTRKRNGKNGGSYKGGVTTPTHGNAKGRVTTTRDGNANSKTEVYTVEASGQGQISQSNQARRKPSTVSGLGPETDFAEQPG